MIELFYILLVIFTQVTKENVKQWIMFHILHMSVYIQGPQLQHQNAKDSTV